MQGNDKNKSSQPVGACLRELMLPSGLKKHKVEWQRDNMDALALICIGGIATCLFGIVLAMTDGDLTIKAGANIVPYATVMVIFVLFLLARRLFRSFVQKYIILTVYLMSSLVFTGDIILETGMKEEYSVFIFCILQLFLSICYIDYPLRIFVFELTFSIIYMIVDVNRRSGPMLETDFTRIFLGLICSLILYTFLIYRRNRLTDTLIGTQEVASRDALTGIFNRGAGQSRISGLAASGITGTFVLMDVDNFKHINDTYGHERGDQVLQAVAAELASSFRSTDIVMRMGGDEFMVYALGMIDQKYVEKKMNEIRSDLHDIVLDEETGDHVSVSAGCLINNGEYRTYDDLYGEADRLLYETKQIGKDGYRIG